MPVSRTSPTLQREQQLFAQGTVGGLDEVGRGALAGPVTVGLVVLNPDCGPVPSGLADSKLLSAKARIALVPHIHEWVRASAVVHRAASFIDECGIMAALTSAAQEAIDHVASEVGDLGSLIIDGPKDYVGPHPRVLSNLPVVKADLTCASVAAASVLAKVERDQLMIDLARDFPAYGWEGNKGYGSASHRSALHSYGPTAWHRRSWRLTLSTDAETHPQSEQGAFFSPMN